MNNNKYPQFEANQVLTDKHLNEAISYLEEQERLTRNHLLGSGIISGFELRRNTAITLEIFEGSASTTEGYLCLLSSENWSGFSPKRFIEYNKIKNYEPQNLAFPYLKDSATIVNYPLFTGITTPIKVLVPTSVSDNTAALLQQADLDNNVIVLFLECKAKELKNCEADSCLDSGKEMTFTLQPLLISKTDADKLISNELSTTAALNEQQLRNLLQARFNLTDIPLAKPKYSNITDTYSVANWSDLFKEKLRNLYVEITSNGRPASIDSALQNILKSDSLAPVSAFTNKLNTYLNTGVITSSNLTAWQYIYDFAADFVDGYKELQEALLKFISYRLPAILSFPMHIRAGRVPAISNMTELFSPAAELYRHELYTSYNINEQQQAYHEALTYYRRLRRIVDDFDAITINQFSSITKVTPSLDKANSLSKRAIPFYYGQPNSSVAPILQLSWNSVYLRWNRNRNALNYAQNSNTISYQDIGAGNDAYNENTALPLVYQQRNAQFFRVEGVLGTTYSTAYSSIMNYRNTYGLPFDVVLLKLNKNVALPVINQSIYFADLESLYNVLKVEVKCLLEKSKNYFSTIKIDASLSYANAPSATAQGVSAIESTKDKTFVNKSYLASEAANTEASTKKYYAVSAPLTGSSSETSYYNYANQPNTMGYMIDYITPATENYLGPVYNYIGAYFGNLKPTQTNALAIINAINALSLAIPEDFASFNEIQYKSKVDALMSVSNNFILYAKNKSDADFIKEKLVKKGELLDFLDRIYYECDWKKLEAVGKEKKNRTDYIFKQNLLSEFLKYHPGAEHMGGVPKGGTLLLIFDEKGTVTGDMALPYICCSAMPPLQYVLGVIQNVVLSGQIRSAANVPLPNATFTIDDVPVALDSQGIYRKSVAPNQSYVLKVSLANFISKQQIITIAENDVIQDITLFNVAEQPKAKLKITVVNAANQALPSAKVKVDGKEVALAADGTVTIDVNANNTYAVEASLDGFFTQNLPANVTVGQLELKIILKTKVSIKVNVLDENKKPLKNAKAFIDNRAMTMIDTGMFQEEIDGDDPHDLKITATGYTTFTEDGIKPNGKNIQKEVFLKQVKTVRINAGIYILQDIVEGNTSSWKYLNNKNASIAFNKKEMEFNPKTPFFFTDAAGFKINTFQVFINDKAAFESSLSTEDKDMIVLLNNASIGKPEGDFSLQIPVNEAQSLEMVDKALAALLNYPPEAEIISRSVEIRMFNKNDATKLYKQLEKANIKVTISVIA